MADSVLDAGLKESVGNDNTKTVAGAPAFYSQMAMKSAVAIQDILLKSAVESSDQLSKISIAALAAQMKRISESDITEAMSNVKQLQSDLSNNLAQLGSQLSNSLAQLNSALAGGQIGAKVAQTTPPESFTPLLELLAGIAATQSSTQAALEAILQRLNAAPAAK